MLNAYAMNGKEGRGVEAIAASSISTVPARRHEERAPLFVVRGGKQNSGLFVKRLAVDNSARWSHVVFSESHHCDIPMNESADG